MPNQPKHQLHLADCIEGVTKLPDDSLDLVLSGPPYFDHITYSSELTDLSSRNYEEFLFAIAKLWENIAPKLKEGGVMALWLHDVYCRNPSNTAGGQDSQDLQDSQDFFELKPFHTDIIRTVADTLNLRNILVWDRYLKKTYPSLPDQAQFGTRFQYILLFSKGKTEYEKEFERLYWNPIQYFKTQPTILGSRFLYQIVFMLGKNGFIYKIFKNSKKHLIKDKYEFKEYLTTCPPEVAEMIIQSFSKEDDTVCDPFLGSGTTMKVANDLNRNCIGFEINREAKDTILRKVNSENIEIFD